MSYYVTLVETELKEENYIENDTEFSTNNDEIDEHTLEYKTELDNFYSTRNQEYLTNSKTREYENVLTDYHSETESSESIQESNEKIPIKETETPKEIEIDKESVGLVEESNLI